MPITELKQVSINILAQNADLIRNIKDEDYAYSLPLLSGNTIGKHVRHVLEIYHELVKGKLSGTVSYDARQRNIQIEQNRLYTLGFIEQLQDQLSSLTNDCELRLLAEFQTAGASLSITTTLARELAYNIEHAIHHMAIMQIAIQHQFAYISLPEDFGIAFSTRQHLKQHVHTHVPAHS